MSAVSETLCPIDLAQMASFYMHDRRRGNILNYFPHTFFFFTSFPLSNLIRWCVGWKCVPVSGFPTVRPLPQLLWFFYNDLGHRNTSSVVCLLGQDIDLQGFLILTSRLQRNSILPLILWLDCKGCVSAQSRCVSDLFRVARARLRKQSGCEVLAALAWKPHSGQRGDRICPLKALTGTSSDDRLCSLSLALGQILTSDLTAFFPQLGRLY